MRTIIAGSRTVREYTHVLSAMNCPERLERIAVSEVVSGGAIGVDTQGERWAKQNNIPVTKFLPDWRKYGRVAGHRRNRQMAEYAEALVAVWDGRSPGTANMITEAMVRGLTVVVWFV